MSRVVLVGEAPGAKEVRCEMPFVGSAGDVLWDALADSGLRRRDVFVVNSVACRPFNLTKPIRTPTPEAIDACAARLGRDIAQHPRTVIVALGVTAIEAVTGQRHYHVDDHPGAELPSRWGGVVLATHHPAYVLRRGASRKEHQRLVADLIHARERDRASA